MRTCLKKYALRLPLHKARLYDPKAIPAQAAWNMGTVEGAKAIGYTDLGILAKGYRADIVLYDVSGMHWMPRYNDLAALVYSANSSDVNTTIVGGKVLMKTKNCLLLMKKNFVQKSLRLKSISVTNILVKTIAVID